MANNIYIFDLESLTDFQQNIDSDFKEYMSTWLDTHESYLVTNSDYNRTVVQLSKPVLKKFKTVFYCAGNEVFENNICKYNQPWKPSKELYTELASILDSHPFTLRTGQHIDMRTGLTNFSIVGNNASASEQELFILADKKHNYRLSIINTLRANHPSIAFTLAGETGIDMHLSGNNSSQILKRFSYFNSTNINYFCVNVDENSNNFQLANLNKVTAYPVTSWENLWSQLIK